MHLLIGENEYLITEKSESPLMFLLSKYRITTKTDSQMLPIPTHGLLQIHEPSICTCHTLLYQSATSDNTDRYSEINDTIK